MSTERPAPSEFGAAYAGYIAKAPEGEIVTSLERQLDEVVGVLGVVPEARAHVVDPPYGWTLAQVVGHLVDAERVFSYRALRFGRGDATPLPGFAEDDYVAAARSDRVELAGLVDEFAQLRRSNVRLFRHLPPEAWSRGGVASGTYVTVRALAWVLAGHVAHHLAIVRERLSDG